MGLKFWAKKSDPEDDRKEERLVEAEKALGDLQHRAHNAIVYLDGRHRRNHWRESVEDMIRGGA